MEGLRHIVGFLDAPAQRELRDTLRKIAAKAPLFHPAMPRTGRPFSVQMTNCGPLGWVADKQGYRYQSTHPETGLKWPVMPKQVHNVWAALSNYPKEAECCLINYYSDKAKMGLHQDKDEENFFAPVVSLSLGDTALFRIGGKNRKDPTQSLKLQSGDALVMAGPARLAYHGIDRVYPRTSDLLEKGGRINLTLRRVNP